MPEWTAETGRQFTLARTAAARMARLYADAGFAVAIDDVIFPAEVDTLFGDPLRGYAFHRIVLRPRLEVAMARNAARSTKAFDTSILASTIQELDRAMAAEPFDPARWHIIDNSDMGLQETVEAIMRWVAV